MASAKTTTQQNVEFASGTVRRHVHRTRTGNYVAKLSAKQGWFYLEQEGDNWVAYAPAGMRKPIK